MAHHHLGLAYADYFATGGGDGVPEMDAGDGRTHHHIHGVHQPGAEAFGDRGYRVPAEPAEAKAGGHFVDFGEYGHHRLLGNHHATLTSLSLHGPAASSLVVHQHQLQAWPQQQGAWHLRGSRFLLPTQQLLQEFCSLPVETTSPAASKPPPTNPANEEDGRRGCSLSSAPSARIQAMDAADLQRLKTKLYTMLDEVDRRYRRYREQMRTVAGSFEAVAGARAAAAYTRLASRTISRHFRALRNGVATQLEAVRRALGEKDAAGVVPRARVVRDETTPRLRVLDQCLRQRRAYQTGALESQPWRPQRGLPERAVSILRAWLFEHFLHPYPSDIDKHILSRQTGLSRSQVSNWFINKRVRLWKPMVEGIYAEEMDDDPVSEGDVRSNTNIGNGAPNPSYTSGEGQGRAGGDEDNGGGEQKPTRAQLVVHDAGSLASVVSIGSSSRDQQQDLGFGVMDQHHLDFVAYGHNGDVGEADGQAFGGGVSLTLGLQQQHSDPYGVVNVAFAAAGPSAPHEFLFTAGGEQEEQRMDVDGGGVFPGAGHNGHPFGVSVEGDAGGVTAGKTNCHQGFQLLRDLAG